MDNDELFLIIKDMYESAMNKLEKKFDEKIDNLSEKIEDSENSIRASIEALRTDLKAVAQGQILLAEKIDRIAAKFDEQTWR